MDVPCAWLSQVARVEEWVPQAKFVTNLCKVNVLEGHDSLNCAHYPLQNYHNSECFVMVCSRK